MGLEEFIPPDVEIGSRQTFTGLIYYVDDFYVNVILYTDPAKRLKLDKYMFTCPSDEIESPREVKIHYWKEKDGKQKAVVELVKSETDDGVLFKRITELWKNATK